MKPMLRHPNQRGPLPRVRLQGGPWIDSQAHAILAGWNASGVSIGALIDRLVFFAVIKKYDPTEQQQTFPQLKSQPKPTHKK